MGDRDRGLFRVADLIEPRREPGAKLPGALAAVGAKIQAQPLTTDQRFTVALAELGPDLSFPCAVAHLHEPGIRFR